MISFQTMLPCNQSLPIIAKMNITESVNHPNQVPCNTSDLLQVNHNTTKSLPVTLAASFDCEIKLHEKYVGHVYSLEGDREQYKWLSAVSFSEDLHTCSMIVYAYTFWTWLL